MAFVSVVLIVVMVVQAVLATLLYQQAKRLTAAQNVHERINAVSSALVALRKEHLALDELVSQWMARSATRAKRERKKEREADEEELEPVQETG